MIFRNIQLYFAKKKLIKLYKIVQSTVSDKIALRDEITKKGDNFLNQVTHIKNKYSIDNPKAFVSDRIHAKQDKELFAKKGKK